MEHEFRFLVLLLQRHVVEIEFFGNVDMAQKGDACFSTKELFKRRLDKHRVCIVAHGTPVVLAKEVIPWPAGQRRPNILDQSLGKILLDGLVILARLVQIHDEITRTLGFENHVVFVRFARILFLVDADRPEVGALRPQVNKDTDQQILEAMTLRVVAASLLHLFILGFDLLVACIQLDLLGLGLRSADLGLLKFRKVIVEFLPRRIRGRVLRAQGFIFAEKRQERREHVLACRQTREGFLNSGIMLDRIRENLHQCGMS